MAGAWLLPLSEDVNEADYLADSDDDDNHSGKHEYGLARFWGENKRKPAH